MEKDEKDTEGFLSILSICEEILNEKTTKEMDNNSKKTAFELKKSILEKQKKNEETRKQIEKIGAEIKRMKQGSIALVEQITTISKMRIYDPRNSRGVLSGIRLSPEAMDKINEQMKKLYIF